MKREKAIDIVRKLLRKANDKGVTEEEAFLFATKAKEILTTYHLSGIEVDEETHRVKYVKEFRVTVPHFDQYINDLCKAVRLLYNCEVYLVGMDQSKSMNEQEATWVFIGEEAGAKIASYVMEYLSRVVETMTEEAWEREHERRSFFGFKFISIGPGGDEWFERLQETKNKLFFMKSYRIGLISRLIDKILRQVRERELAEQALVIYTKEAVENYVNEKYGGVQKQEEIREEPGIDPRAAGMGYMAGEGVYPHAAIEGGKK